MTHPKKTNKSRQTKTASAKSRQAKATSAKNRTAKTQNDSAAKTTNNSATSDSTTNNKTASEATNAGPKKTGPTKALVRREATTPNLRAALLADFQALRVSLSAEDFDHALAEAEREGLSHLEFLRRLVGPLADRRRERSIAYRIREAGFPDTKTLEGFDWTFNTDAIDRTWIEDLATGEFVRRGANLVMVGQSGVGKSHLLMGLGRRLCAFGYRVRYTTSAELLQRLTASLADGTLPSQLRWCSRFDLLIIDEFGFDQIERRESPQAAHLLYKVINARTGRRSTALGTNVEFDAWSDYLGDAPLAMAVLDRVVYRAIMMPIAGKSYRAAQAQRPGDIESSSQPSTSPADNSQ